MRVWTMTESSSLDMPEVFIVPRELWHSAGPILWGEEAEIIPLPKGSPVVLARDLRVMIVVDTPSIRQHRYRNFREAAQLAEQQGSAEVGIWTVGLNEKMLPSVIFGLEQGFYHYGEHKDPVQEIKVVADQTLFERLELLSAIACGQSWARNKVNCPANEKPPEHLAVLYQQDAPKAIQFHTYTHEALKELGAGGILAVGSGSERPPVLLVGRYQGQPGAPWLALVGKGIVFDSGGISLKAREGMGKLKADMAGSAAVMAAVRIVAENAWPINVMAWAPLAENLPDGAAYRPGDVVTMLDNTRVEIISTDAEGRLVLADALTMAISEGASAVVDIATLTGSNVVALGAIRATLIGNNEVLAKEVRESGDMMEEPVWEMPHDAEYALLNRSSIADLKNSGGRAGGTISAGLFVGNFAGKVPWAHVDIAGLAFNDTDSTGGATGYGVALLVEMCKRWGHASRDI